MLEPHPRRADSENEADQDTIAGMLFPDAGAVVRYRFECDGADELDVDAFSATEALNTPYLIELELTAVSEIAETADLLGRDARVRLERGRHHRAFAGIVEAVTVRDDGEIRQTSAVRIRPALSALRLNRNTRIFQEETALEIITGVLSAGLAPYRREIDASALDPERYHDRDYCVQYQESDFDFVHRLMEEEGIGYYFEHAEVEKLVLFDRPGALSTVETIDGGPVRYDHMARGVMATESVVRFEPSHRFGPTKVTVRDHDWARALPEVEETVEIEEEQRRAREPSQEVYEHGFARALTISEDSELITAAVSLVTSTLLPAVLPFGFDDIVQNLPGAVVAGFTSDNADHQAQIRTELARRDCERAAGASLVIGFSAGRAFDLLEHPTLGADGEYYLTKVTHSSTNAEGGDQREGGGNYRNEFECLRRSVPWRPDRTTEKPRIYGVQTATVTGPIGMDVHTDQHGRIKARFPWDRSDVDPLGNYTCWLRVSQAWAGQGSPGFMFIPRVGMEVVVSFVDGDPDRPLVTGCVYNGRNATPDLLPRQATKSIIRTRTVPHGPGYNELSFEDAMGRERVYIRAERDLEERVFNDHKSHVDRDQEILIGADQVEQVMGDQEHFVGGTRSKVVGNDERESTGGNHSHGIDGNASVEVGGAYRISVETGGMITEVSDGEYVVLASGRLLIAQDEGNSISMVTSGDDAGILVEASGATMHVSEERIALTVGESSLVITPTEIRVNNKTMPA